MRVDGSGRLWENLDGFAFTSSTLSDPLPCHFFLNSLCIMQDKHCGWFVREGVKLENSYAKYPPSVIPFHKFRHFGLWVYHYERKQSYHHDQRPRDLIPVLCCCSHHTPRSADRWTTDSVSSVRAEPLNSCFLTHDLLPHHAGPVPSDRTRAGYGSDRLQDDRMRRSTWESRLNYPPEGGRGGGLWKVPPAEMRIS